MTVIASSTAERLKNDTWDLHQTAEQSPFQQMLVAGRVGRDGYVEFLRQMRHVHVALERHLRTAAARIPALAGVVKDYQYQAGYLDEDLQFFGHAPDASPPNAAVSQLIVEIDRLAAGDPLALLGMHYVLEGSNNGSKYIARALQRSLQLQSGPGMRYLDPYGDSQRAYWSQFKADLDAASFSAAEVDRLVAAAKLMFAGMTKIGADILRTLNISPEAAAAMGAPAGHGHGHGHGHEHGHGHSHGHGQPHGEQAHAHAGHGHAHGGHGHAQGGDGHAGRPHGDGGHAPSHSHGGHGQG